MVKRVAGYTVHLLAQKVPTTVKKSIDFLKFLIFLKKVAKPFGDSSRLTLMFTADA